MESKEITNPLKNADLFENVDVKSIDEEERAPLIIERVLESGHDSDVRWILSDMRKHVLHIAQAPRKNSIRKVRISGDFSLNKIDNQTPSSPATRSPANPRDLLRKELVGSYAL